MPIDKNKAFLESVCWFVICVFMVTSVWSWVMAAIDFESEEQLHRVAAPHRKRFLRPVSSNALPNRVFLLKLGPIRPAQNSFIPLFPSQVACSNRAQRGQQQRRRFRHPEAGWLPCLRVRSPEKSSSSSLLLNSRSRECTMRRFGSAINAHESIWR